MPKRRRHSVVQSPTQRVRMWDAKMSPSAVAAYLESTKPLGLEKQLFYQSAYQHVVDTVKQILWARGVETHLVQEYTWYALELWQLTQRFKSKALKLEAEGTYLKYMYRGRDKVVLREIASALGIKLSSDDEIFERLGAVVAVPREVIAEGTLVADGTEQTVVEYVGLAVVHGYIDLQNMETGDEVVIRAYVRFKPDGAYKKYAEETYSGPQSLPALYVLPRLTVYGIKVTLQQTAGTYKSFDYIFVKE